jgi:hypothetical protein
VKGLRTPIGKLDEEIPEAIWSPGRPLPNVYRGKPVEMVQQMASTMGPGVSISQAIDTLLQALSRDGRLHLRIVGDPPVNIRASIFVYTLLQSGICQPMARA